MGLPDIKKTLLGDDKYKDKPIRFIDKNDHYELFFADEFKVPHGEDKWMGPAETGLVDILQDLKDADKSKELHVFVGSYGGDVDALVMLIQQIKQFKWTVGVSLGYVCSCGWMLLFTCNEVYMSPYSRCMYHDMSSMSFGKVTEIAEETSAHMKWWNLIIEQTHTKDILTEEELKKSHFTELWFTGKELISRHCALPIETYANRKPPQTIPVIRSDSFLFVENLDHTYTIFSPVDNTSKPVTYWDVIKIVNGVTKIKETRTKQKKKSSKKKLQKHLKQKRKVNKVIL